MTWAGIPEAWESHSLSQGTMVTVVPETFPFECELALRLNKMLWGTNTLYTMLRGISATSAVSKHYHNGQKHDESMDLTAEVNKLPQLRCT